MGSIQQDGNEQVCDRETVTILVTGFRSFLERYPMNPSFEITRLLPDFLPAMSPHKAAINIISYGTPIRVSYDEVRGLVPRMLKAYEGTIDIVLHIGMASGRKHYAIERFARRDGYTRNEDIDGKVPPVDEGRTIYQDCPPIMTTSLDVDKVLLNWQDNILSIPEGQPGSAAGTRSSDDAGRYLCDYIYFNSLAYCGRKSETMTDGKATDRPVLFFHVPPESDSRSLESGRAVTIALIRAIADTFTAQRREDNAETTSWEWNEE